MGGARCANTALKPNILSATPACTCLIWQCRHQRVGCVGAGKFVPRPVTENDQDIERIRDPWFEEAFSQTTQSIAAGEPLRGVHCAHRPLPAGIPGGAAQDVQPLARRVLESLAPLPWRVPGLGGIS